MKRIISVFLLIMIVLGVSGCMSNESNNPGVIPQTGSAFTKLGTERMEKAVGNFLNQKYGETFEIDKLALEFGGEDVYYRAVFHSAQRPEKGVLYCRETDDGISVQIDGVACYMEDDYANVILQERYAAAMQEELGEDVLVKCQFYTPDHMLTGEEFESGVEACLEKAELFPYLYVYVFTDKAGPDAQLKEAAEAYMGKLNVYRQYLYVVHQMGEYPGDWETLYYENESDFEGYLLHRSEAKVLDFAAFELDKGIVKQTVIER